MSRLNHFSGLRTADMLLAAERFGTPAYVYDAPFIAGRCGELLAMPNAYGLIIRYAMKANSNRSILRLVHGLGLKMDASSLNEAQRALLAGIPHEDILLTAQELPLGQRRRELMDLMLEGLRYNVCSLRQLHGVGDFAAEHHLPLTIRVHPGIGSGESAARVTGDNYSCFGIHLNDLPQALAYAREKGIVFERVHAHIGSGTDPDIWSAYVDLILNILEKNFPKAHTINFGGGFKEARMPHEKHAELALIGELTRCRIEQTYARTGRKLRVEFEPGTFVVANAGYVVTQVIDKKKTGGKGLDFLIVNGGVNINARPLLYGSQHPFYVIAADGRLLSAECDADLTAHNFEAVVVGTCCESGDSQCLNAAGLNAPRPMAEPEAGDLVVIGGAGAYCSSMTPMNYNSHLQIPEVLWANGDLTLIRKKQTLEQLTWNEV